MQAMETIQHKLFVLRNYEAIFKGETVRQLKPVCCGQELGLGELLKTTVNASNVEIDGSCFTMFEVACPTCGQMIAPKWDVRA